MPPFYVILLCDRRSVIHNNTSATIVKKKTTLNCRKLFKYLYTFSAYDYNRFLSIKLTYLSTMIWNISQKRPTQLKKEIINSTLILKDKCIMVLPTKGILIIKFTTSQVVVSPSD